MCGICGIINTDGVPALKGDVERMVQSIIHRGPDGQGVSIMGAAGLGHCRLLILGHGLKAKVLTMSQGLFTLKNHVFLNTLIKMLYVNKLKNTWTESPTNAYLFGHC